MTRRVHIDHLDISVAGVDEATVRSALDALPAALGAALGAAPGPPNGPRPEAAGVVRVGAGAGAADVARAIAGQVAARVRAAGRGT